MKNYWDQGERRNMQGSNEEETLPPHVYKIADDSYRSIEKLKIQRLIPKMGQDEEDVQ
jgi:myosin heavy subunit